MYRGIMFTHYKISKYMYLICHVKNFYTLKSKYVENKKNIAHYSSFTILTEKINLSK